MSKKFLLRFLSFLFLMMAGCEMHPLIEGLWVVKNVKVGDQEMTPNARWMRFNSDSTQQSGNGWYQHSYGSWSFNNDLQELTVTDLNGTKDPYEPFKVEIENDKMTWSRLEDGDKIVVSLERTQQLPTSYGDQIIGLWKLDKAVGNRAYFSPDSNQESSDYIFFRWDRQFVLNTEKGRINGVYNVNGHKPQVELIPYGKEVTRDFWQIDFEENAMTLNLINSDTLVSRRFIRIHDFPQQK